MRYPTPFLVSPAARSGRLLGSLTMIQQNPDAARAATRADTAATPAYEPPPLGDNPSSAAQGTTPGSFANRGRVGTPWTFASPDTPGMPPPSDKTAWDFLPPDWEVEVVPAAG